MVWAQLMAEGTTMGRPRSALDMIIGAVARTNGCVIVTDNEKDFTEVDVFNPLRAGKPR
jgi:toxin FitB